LPQDDCLKAVPDYSFCMTRVMQREWQRPISMLLMPLHARARASTSFPASALSFRALIANPRKLFAKKYSTYSCWQQNVSIVAI
jgi:hypothetical protein